MFGAEGVMAYSYKSRRILAKENVLFPQRKIKAATTRGQGRPSLDQRMSHDEKLRDEWAGRAVEIVAQMG